MEFLKEIFTTMYASFVEGFKEAYRKSYEAAYSFMTGDREKRFRIKKKE